MLNVAIIPARAGSVRLKNKNRKKINGISLVNWSVNFAKKLNFLHDIVVTSDDKVILKDVNLNNKSVITIDRPKSLAKKETKSEDVIFHVLKKYEKLYGQVSTILLLQPTSPIRSVRLVQSGYRKFVYYKKKKSVVSVSKFHSPNKRNFKIKNKKLDISKKYNKNLYQMDGNFYFANPLFLKKYKSFFYKNKTHPIILKKKKLSIDIDTKEDFNRAKFYLKK